MRIHNLLIALCLGWFLSSCVPTKDLTYLQGADGVDNMQVSVGRVTAPYRLQVNDVLSIRVKAVDQELVGFLNPIDDRNSNATGQERLYYDGFRVNEHGVIRVPELGEIEVIGKTVEEIRGLVEQRLMDTIFKEESQMFVTVKLAGISYTITGEVGAPGTNIIYKDQVSIIDAIANSGDIPLTGDKTAVRIIRKLPTGYAVRTLDLTQATVLADPFFELQPNDLIVVDPLPQKSIGTGTTGFQTFTQLASIVTLAVTTILLITR